MILLGFVLNQKKWDVTPYCQYSWWSSCLRSRYCRPLSIVFLLNSHDRPHIVDRNVSMWWWCVFSTVPLKLYLYSQLSNCIISNRQLTFSVPCLYYHCQTYRIGLAYNTTFLLMDSERIFCLMLICLLKYYIYTFSFWMHSMWITRSESNYTLKFLLRTLKNAVFVSNVGSFFKARKNLNMSQACVMLHVTIATTKRDYRWYWDWWKLQQEVENLILICLTTHKKPMKNKFRKTLDIALRLLSACFYILEENNIYTMYWLYFKKSNMFYIKHNLQCQFIFKHI